MKLEFKVPSMVCEGCVDTVKKAIAKVDSTAQVDVVLETKAVTVETESSAESIQQAIAGAGHTVA
ncbi:heavy-metal-associated domain-containing protein [Roseofilum sp. BLCC_M154]|uniref:Heavy-metal-associated domain-containing protein n=1 Tax=Roseofilum acuticapitatum BLCC-M154 TaxID=3022444 RepID=A0ABT7AM61_9CYAN|nr:heavy-metal-associated domain-containing protein [Roseofilum acuticapitatum]MDJ1167986.1 heavy-metal-associated domain-containing protein [Roseofilum acuticapitatum BLCC-M154]